MLCRAGRLSSGRMRCSRMCTSTRTGLGADSLILGCTVPSIHSRKTSQEQDFWDPSSSSSGSVAKLSRSPWRSPHLLPQCVMLGLVVLCARVPHFHRLLHQSAKCGSPSCYDCSQLHPDTVEYSLHHVIPRLTKILESIEITRRLRCEHITVRVHR